MRCSLTFLLAGLLSFSQVSAQGLPNLSSVIAAESSSASASAAASSSASGSPSSITSAAAAASSAALPGLSSSAYDGITNAPTLSGQYNYPPPSVPPTAEAPYMQKSPLPEGTVFICVGAVLGFFAMVVIAWRGLVVWSLHRSVRRSSPQRYRHEYGGGDAKASMLRNAAVPPFYGHVPGSALSLDQLGPSGKSGVKTHHTPSESLFFSPTAGVGAHSNILPNRSSAYLPPGYYAAGTAAPGGGGGGGTGATPLEMPHERPSTVGLSIQPSTTTLNSAAQGRVPSAYLEDLFDNYPPDNMIDDTSSRGRRY